MLESATFPTQEAEFQRSPLWVLLYLYYTILNAEATKLGTVTHMGRACFRRYPRHIALHKCVARFVSDICVSCKDIRVGL